MKSIRWSTPAWLWATRSVASLPWWALSPPVVRKAFPTTAWPCGSRVVEAGPTTSAVLPWWCLGPAIACAGATARNPAAKRKGTFGPGWGPYTSPPGKGGVEHGCTRDLCFNAFLGVFGSAWGSLRKTRQWLDMIAHKKKVHLYFFRSQIRTYCTIASPSSRFCTYPNHQIGFTRAHTGDIYIILRRAGAQQVSQRSRYLATLSCALGGLGLVWYRVFVTQGICFVHRVVTCYSPSHHNVPALAIPHLLSTRILIRHDHTANLSHKTGFQDLSGIKSIGCSWDFHGFFKGRKTIKNSQLQQLSAPPKRLALQRHSAAATWRAAPVCRVLLGPKKWCFPGWVRRECQVSCSGFYVYIYIYLYNQTNQSNNPNICEFDLLFFLVWLLGRSIRFHSDV